MKKNIVTAIIIILGMVGAYFAYLKYVEFKFINSLTPAVKNSSLRISNELRVMLSNDSNMTYGEIFKKLEEDISKIDEKILEIQSLSNPNTQHIADPILAYLNEGQEMLRATLSLYRKRLSYESATETVLDSIKTLKESTSSYELKSASQRSDSAMEELKKTGKELTAANNALYESVKKMRILLPKAAMVVSKNALIDNAELLKIEKATKEAKEN